MTPLIRDGKEITKVISFKEVVVLSENMKNISKALKSLAGQPTFKKISKNLLSLSARAAEGSKGTAKQIRTQLVALAKKVDKKSGLKLSKMSQLAGTYESVDLVEIFSRAQMKKAIGIARASKGSYTKAYNEIEKIKKGLGDEHIIAGALKKANEGLDESLNESCGCPDHMDHANCDENCNCSMNEAVDCRTKDFKTAMKRSEALKAKREASKLSEVDKIMARTNKSLSGMAETMVASGSDATGNIEYPDQTLGKVKKRKGFKESLEENYFTAQYYNSNGNAVDDKFMNFKTKSAADKYAKKGNSIDRVGGKYKVFMIKGTLK